MARELHNLLVNRIIDRALGDVAPRASGRLLDIGCGMKPYRQIFAPYVSEHVGVDFAETPHGLATVDLVSTAYEIPVADGSFDAVLCTSVLEHLEEPAAALEEARRVLGQGGVAIYVVPFMWHLHEEPRDFFRYSVYGIRHLFERSGFAIEEVRALGGFWITFGQLLAYYLQRFRRGPLRVLPVVETLSVAVQAAAAGLDRLDSATQWTWGYLVVARAVTA